VTGPNILVEQTSRNSRPSTNNMHCVNVLGEKRRWRDGEKA